MADTESVFYLKEDEIDIGSDNGSSIYAEVQVADDGALLSSDGEEDFNAATYNLETADDSPGTEPSAVDRPDHYDSSGEVIEDFVRNFLVRMGLKRTVHSFETEWYEFSVTNKLSDYHKQTVPDVYTQNKSLHQEVELLKEQAKSFKEAATQAKEKYVQLKKERDYHRMHHRRVLQEKDRLITDIKRLKEHFSVYEPTLKGLKTKYEAATREKLLATLARDKAVAEVECLQSTIHSLQPSTSYSKSQPLPSIEDKDKDSHSPRKTISLPAEPGNPYRNLSTLPLCAHLTRVGGFQLTGTIAAHDYPLSCLAIHPTKDLLATGSDDHTWKIWSIPNGELLMTGEGHEDWLSSVQFNPGGAYLATTSGDGSVKLWNLAEAAASLTLSDHCQPVWDCSWHWSGQMIASGAMDNCCKLWNVESGQCIVTLRAHIDSINAVNFLPYSNILATASADKTIQLWDSRTGLTVQTLAGHQNSCNEVISNYQGMELFSSDCYGTVIQWEVGSGKYIKHWDMGPHPVNGLGIDPAGTVLACALGSHKITLLNLETGEETALEGHTDSVEGVAYNHHANALYSASADGKIAIWQ